MRTKHTDTLTHAPAHTAATQTTSAQAVPLKSGATAHKPAFSSRDLVLGGMFAAVMAVISQLSIPMPTGVPITIQLFGVTLIGVVLGWRLGLLAMTAYILLGATGLPVFSNFRGGLGVLTGVTGGYLWSYPLMVALCGIRPKTESTHLDTLLTILLALIGLMIVETSGGLQWAALAGDKTVAAVFTYSIVAFIPKDILLTILAVLIGRPIQKTLKKL